MLTWQVGSGSSSQTPEQTPLRLTHGHTGKGQNHRTSEDPRLTNSLTVTAQPAKSARQRPKTTPRDKST